VEMSRVLEGIRFIAFILIIYGKQKISS
jgi:hypothetical protein